VKAKLPKEVSAFQSPERGEPPVGAVLCDGVGGKEGMEGREERGEQERENSRTETRA
jgi:hypothetical protein